MELLTRDELEDLEALLGETDASDVAAYFHPLANLFPLMLGAAGDELGASMVANGQREHCVIFEGKILDGRNRVIQARKRGLTPRVRPFDPKTDGDPLQFVIDLNLHRRQLSESQRAMAAARIENMRQGERSDLVEPSANLHKVSRTQAAQMVNVSERSVASAAAVQRDAILPVTEAVEQGVISVAAAETLSTLPKEEQREIVLTLPCGPDGRLTPEARKQLAPVVAKVRAEKQAEKKQRRVEREQELASRILVSPTKKYGVILDDYEWDHVPYSRETGMDRHPSNHYPTSADAHTPEEIVARTSARFACAADDCVWFSWTTIPHLAIALRVGELRGFTYKSHRVWSKIRNGKGRGPGYWVTGEHELLLIFTRGKVVAPDTAHFRSLFEAPVGEHSEKPDAQYEFIEYHFPNIPKIELNARRARNGWDRWGFESPVENASATAPSGECQVGSAHADCGGDESPAVLAHEGVSSSLKFMPVDHVCCDRDEWPRGEVCELPDGFSPIGVHAELFNTDAGAKYEDGIPTFLRRAK